MWGRGGSARQRPTGGSGNKNWFQIFFSPFSINTEMILWPSKIARALGKSENFLGGKLNDLQQLSLLALGIDLNEFWIKIQI
jgi:hypothetical protein